MISHPWRDRVSFANGSSHTQQVQLSFFFIKDLESFYYQGFQCFNEVI